MLVGLVVSVGVEVVADLGSGVVLVVGSLAAVEVLVALVVQ